MLLLKNRKDQYKVLSVFHRALSLELHNLKERPEILWQQMYNRLQWVDGKDRDGAVFRVITPEFQKRTAPGAGQWIHNRCRTKESEALIMILKGHTDKVHSCAFSPDGKIIASVGGDIWSKKDNTVRLWDTETSNEKKVLTGHTDRVNSCAFSPDGKTVASASDDNTVRLWEAETGNLLYTFPCIGGVHTCSFNPSGKIITAVDKGGNIYILELFGFKNMIMKNTYYK